MYPILSYQNIATFDAQEVCSRRSSKLLTQNKVIRFILGPPSRSHIGPAEFSGANMLPVPLRVDQLKLNHMALLQVILKVKLQ